MKERLGFIGLGVMGGPMVKNLSARFPGVSIFDSDPQKVRSASIPGRTAAARDLTELGRTSDLVFLSLPGSEAVREVVLGRDGLAPAMGRGGVIIDTSTTETGTTVEVASALKERRILFLDSPVSGGEKAAVEGTLSFMVGGPEETFSRCAGFMAAMGVSVVRMGETPMGQATKCVNQMIVGATFAVIAEAFALGSRAGLDPKTLYEAIKGGWAGSKLLDVAAGDMFSREFKPGGTVDIFWKDLGYALSLARETGSPTPVTALAHEIFKTARAAGDGAKSQTAVVRLWERLLGRDIK